MPNDSLIVRLRTFARLSVEEEAQLRALCTDVRSVSPRKNIISDHERPEHLHLIVKGWAARYKILPDGLRQITAFLIPGDFCDLHVTILGHMDHGIVALTPCLVAYVPSEKLDELTSSHNNLTRALWWATLVDEGVLRAWIVNNGRRDAFHRIAHLLCEMHCRMKMVGLVENNRLDLPLTQEDLGDAVGLTPVHTNRTLQRLRREGLIVLQSQNLTVPNVKALEEAAGFDATYLHIKRRVPV